MRDNLEMLLSVILSVLLLVFVLSMQTWVPADLPVTQGILRIPSKNITADIITYEQGDACGCSDVLWHGRVAMTEFDISDVSLMDAATLTTEDGGAYALECVEIQGGMRMGTRLIGWGGEIRPKGTILIFSNNHVYRFVML